MKPNFALNLSEDGISLLHRAAHGAGWVEVGTVALDDPDLGGGLKGLRDKAKVIEGPGFATKIILPPSQLLFASVDVAGDLDAEVAAALEERTPYTIDQLSFDTSGAAPDVKIVAVARDTLEEAEGFIGPYGFNLVGFTAIPDPDHFDGEPHLGGMPSGGASFTTDSAPVQIISAAQAEAAAAAAEAEAGQAREAALLEAQQRAETEEQPEPELDLDAAPEPQPEPAPEPQPEPQPDPEEPDADAAALPPTAPAAFSSRRKPSLGPATDADTGDKVTSRTPRIAIPADDQRAQPARSKPRKVEPRIKTGAAASPKPAPALVPPSTPTAAQIGQVASGAATKATALAGGLMQGVSNMRARKAAAREEAAREEAAAAATADQVADPIAALAARQAAGKPRFLGLILTGFLILALLIFAALSSYLLPEETLSRLLGRDQAQTEIAQTEPAPAAVEAPRPLLIDEQDVPAFTAAPDEDIAPPQTAAEAAPPQLPPAPATMTANEAQTAYAVSGIWQLSPDLRPSLEDETLDGLYDSSLDPALAFEDAPALSSFDALSQSLSFQQPSAPPAASVLFSLDNRGLVRPSPTGALNPDGIFVFSGKPPIAAIPRPDGLVPQALIDEQAALDTASTQDEEAALDPEALLRPNPEFAGFTPRQRPADLQERFERATQNGRSTSELAAIRPLPRPADKAKARQEAIERALAEAAAADAAQEAEAAAAEAIAEADRLKQEQEQQAQEQAQQEQAEQGTALAVARSARPGSRPRNFERVVTRAKRNTAAAASTAQPSRGSGPAVARASRATPTAPTRASVARAATDNNALALGKVALVGVFGTSSNRRALVRMPNGRFKKVAVGDRVDGGRVAAIGEGQLRYTKGSRTVTLQMPKG